jgi:hypothetical protein
MERRTMLRIHNSKGKYVGLFPLFPYSPFSATLRSSRRHTMLKNLACKLTIGAALLALVTPAALAQTGGDPEPGMVHVILAYLGLA